ncbi:MAG: VTT domain-containing protein [bacterium]|nr:VTT domain-containing protein [bacterium]
MIPNFDLVQLTKTIGYLGIFGIIFAESGLLIGFFLPGDSLLFTAGFLASQGFFNIALLCGLTFVAAVTGDSVGYTFGRRVGRRLFRKEESVFFHKDHLLKAQAFYEKHGGKTIVLARFMPFVRTFAPIVAGVGLMHYPKFLAYNLLGGFLWAVCIPLAGYFLGSIIPDVDTYLLPIIMLIIILSVLPSALHILRDKPTRTRLLQFFFSSIRR